MGELAIGVCGWYIDRQDVARSVAVAGELGFSAVQVGFFSRGAISAFRGLETGTGSKLPVAPEGSTPPTRGGATLVGAFVAFEGEDYSSIARIAETGGFMPDERYVERAAVLDEVIEIAADLECPSVALHAGTVPADRGSGTFAKLVERVRRACDACAARGLRLLVETGRESAEALLAMMAAVDRPNLGVNFDSGNFTVYGTDDAAAAVSKLRGRIELVHIKDAFRSTSPGVEYGRPAPLGQGDVNVARVISKLRAVGYRGPLLLEIDARMAGVEVLRQGAEYLRSMIG